MTKFKTISYLSLCFIGFSIFYLDYWFCWLMLYFFFFIIRIDSMADLVGARLEENVGYLQFIRDEIKKAKASLKGVQ